MLDLELRMPAVAATERESAVRADAVPVQSIAGRWADEPAVRFRAAAEPADLCAEADVTAVRAAEPAAVRSEHPIAAMRAGLAAIRTNKHRRADLYRNAGADRWQDPAVP